MHIEQACKLQKMKVTVSCRIFKTTYHNDSFLLLFRKRNLQSFDIQCE